MRALGHVRHGGGRMTPPRIARPVRLPCHVCGKDTPHMWQPRARRFRCEVCGAMHMESKR